MAQRVGPRWPAFQLGVRGLRVLRYLPHFVRLYWRLLCDRRVSIWPKALLLLSALYVISPVDLIPDCIPFIGYLDDLVLAAIVVDGVLSYVDRSLLLKYWPGSAASLDAAAAVARRLAGWVPSRIKARIFSRRRRPA